MRNKKDIWIITMTTIIFKREGSKLIVNLR